VVAPGAAALAQHPVYDALTDLDAVRAFMGLHVWAVYDFMLLLGRLRSAFAPSGLVWTPPYARAATRAVNEITLAEESDPFPYGGHCSHFELYLAAMTEAGADVVPVIEFVGRVRAGAGITHALLHPQVPHAARAFCSTTVALARQLPAAAAAFCFGREQLLPGICAALLERGAAAPLWCEYLRRHVSLDGEVHGPAAAAILTAACRDDDDWKVATDAALTALAARGHLWDAALRLLQA
jgi:hypothetical protein